MSRNDNVPEETHEHVARMPINGFHGPPVSGGGIEAREKSNARAAIHEAAARMAWLGQPMGNMVLEPAVGYRQEFQQGTVWTTGITSVASRVEAHEVHGNIRTRFNQVKGGSAWQLGVPLTDEAWARDHAGRFNNFERGCIY